MSSRESLPELALGHSDDEGKVDLGKCWGYIESMGEVRV